jgi:hypothetical protein
MQQTCRDCALPWLDAPCANCGCREPAAPSPATPPPAEPLPRRKPAKASSGGGKTTKVATDAAGAQRVSTTVARTSTTVSPPNGAPITRAVD